MMRAEREPLRAAWANPIVFEPLERRLLLSGNLPSIDSIAADNRGQIVLTATQDLDETTIDETSVLVFTAGADAIFGTADDVLVNRTITYDASTRTITIDAEVGVDERYHVFLDGSIIKGVDGTLLDGEFNGLTVVSGDGVAGGDLEFFTAPAQNLVARFSTIVGVLDLQLFRSATPLTVSNFLKIANSGQYDNSFIHRLIDSFVIQGGGFNADVDLSPIPEGATVPNEPGISNTRGTIAMAKRPGDPNSATNQWFFNLADNSQNLDNQNGGFTVFGEVANPESLAVMDALASFMTVNASGQGSAFTDLPVIDPTVVDANGGIVTPDDLIVISRIAILMDVSDQPIGELDTTGAKEITSADGSVVVRIFDLDQVGLPDASQFMRVFFGPGRSIARIDILDALTTERIGIQISGADFVGGVLDFRGSGGGSVAFIVSDGAIGWISMAEAITGENLNGKVLPGQALPADIDRDGDFDDRLALFVPTGVVQSFVSYNGLQGDIVAPRISFVRIFGLTIQSDFAFDDPLFPQLRIWAPSFFLDRVIDSEIRTTGEITDIIAREWLDNDARQETIRATTIRSITMFGGFGATTFGNFEAGVITTGVNVFGDSIGWVSVRGTIFGADWRIAGATRFIGIGGDASNWNATFDGPVWSISAGVMRNVTIDVNGPVPHVFVRGWEGGSFQAQWSWSITSQRLWGSLGNFEADVTLTGPPLFPTSPTLGGFTVFGDLQNSTIDVTGGISYFGVFGLTSGNNVQVSRAVTTTWLNDVRNTTVQYDRGGNFIRARSWDAGMLTLGPTQTVIIDLGMSADLSASFIGWFWIPGGGYTGQMDLLKVNRLEIAGDMADSVINFNQNRNPGEPVVDFLIVRGEVRNTEINSFFDLGIVELGAMHDSNLHVGFDFALIGFPDTPDSMLVESRIERLTIGYPGSGVPQFTNSFVAAHQIGTLTILEAGTDNFGTPFGVAANSIQSTFSVVTFGPDRIAVNDLFNARSDSRGDFQFRYRLQTPGAV